MVTERSLRRTADPGFIHELFGEQFDLWIGGTTLRQIRHGMSVRELSGPAGHRWLQTLLNQTISSGTVQCRSCFGRLVCAIPVNLDQGRGAAVAELSLEQAADVLQRTGDLAVASRMAGMQVEADQSVTRRCAHCEDEPHDNRLRADQSELNWLNQLPASVVPRPEDVPLLSVAGRILPQLRELVQARALVLVERPPAAAAAGRLPTPLWHCGSVVSDGAVQNLIERHASAIADRNGLCLNLPAPLQSRDSREAVLSAVIVPVNCPGRSSAWLAAVNKDLRKLATGEAAGRYGAEVGTADIEFGEAEISLMRAASSVLTTNGGIMELLNDREQLLTGVVRTLVNALDAKDSYTCGHSDRVAEFARLTARKLGIDAKTCEQIHLAGLLHDIGKVGVPDQILNKPSGVTDEEMEIIRQHPVIGHQILQHLNSFEYVLPAVLHHHESFDGSGYPHGLRGDSIPLSARILAVADAWDAMTSDRSYRRGMSPERATAILQEGAGVQWDPDCVAAFLNTMDAVRMRMDNAHSNVAVPGSVRRAAVATMAGWPEHTIESVAVAEQRMRIATAVNEPSSGSQDL